MPGVEGQVGEAQDLVVAGRGAAAEQGPDPGQQLLQGEGLDEVVVGAGVEPGHPVVDRGPGGEHEHRGVVAGLAQAAAHLEPVHPRHGHVEDDGVGRPLGVGAERGRAVLGRLGLVALEPQGAVQGLAHRGFVVDHQHSHPFQFDGTR